MMKNDLLEFKLVSEYVFDTIMFTFKKRLILLENKDRYQHVQTSTTIKKQIEDDIINTISSKINKFIKYTQQCVKTNH